MTTVYSYLGKASDTGAEGSSLHILRNHMFYAFRGILASRVRRAPLFISLLALSQGRPLVYLHYPYKYKSCKLLPVSLGELTKQTRSYMSTPVGVLIITKTRGQRMNECENTHTVLKYIS